MENLIKIFVVSAKGKSKDKTFFNYRTPMNLIVKGEEDKGPQTKYVDLKFRQTADIKGVKIGKDYIRGYLLCKPENVDAPHIYEIKEESKDGVLTKKYPAVWVSAVEEYEPRQKVATQSAFLPETSDDAETELGGSDE